MLTAKVEEVRMGRITSIGSLPIKSNGIMPVYKRQSGMTFMKTAERWHVRVERRGSTKAWTATEEVVTYDPDEMVEVIVE